MIDADSGQQLHSFSVEAPEPQPAPAEAAHAIAPAMSDLVLAASGANDRQPLLDEEAQPSIRQRCSDFRRRDLAASSGRCVRGSASVLGAVLLLLLLCSHLFQHCAHLCLALRDCVTLVS